VEPGATTPSPYPQLITQRLTMKTTVTKIKTADENGKEYTIEFHQPYKQSNYLSGEQELIPELGYYKWNGTRISPPNNNVFYLSTINTKVKKID
jgi:hypothetical protein